MSDRAAAHGPPLDLDLPLERRPPAGRRFLLAASAALVLTAALAAGLVGLLVKEREADLHAALAARLDALAGGRAEVLHTWLDGTARIGVRLTQSELVRLFVREMALAEAGLPLAEALAEQMPYMQLVLAEFVAANELAAAQLLGRDGRVLLAAGAAAELAPEQARSVDHLLERRAPRLFVAPREQGAAIVVDVLLPIEAPLGWQGEAGGPAGALSMTVPAGPRLRELLAAMALSAPGERLRLVVPGEDAPRQLWLEDDALRLAPLTAAAGLRPGEPVAYGARTAPDGRPVLARGVPLEELGWSVVQETAAEAALAPVRAFRRGAAAIALLATIALAAAFAAFWWRQSGAHHRELARQYRELAERIQRHRRLLDSVTAAVPEMIGLKDLEGRYRWVNRAFAAAVGLEAEAVAGRRDGELLDAATAALLARADARAIDGGAAVIEEARLTLQGRHRILQLSTVPLLDGAGGVAGLVTVARDLTLLVQQREQRDRAVRAAVDALARTVELADPYLLGHSRRLGELAQAVGRRLGLGEAELATLGLAAALSQIGKTFIPAAILQKPERHTPEETVVMQGHVDHALAILDGIDFQLPVTAAIAQMHERLDGSGYPRRLIGEEIDGFGRILGAADVFCARTAPRGYRDRIEPKEALRVLAEHSERYDAEVVAALAEVALANAAADGAPGDMPGDAAARRSA